MTKVPDTRAGPCCRVGGFCCPHLWCYQTLLVYRDPMMSKVKGHPPPSWMVVAL